MTKNKDYAGIDLFRVIAAILIIANHTSPLASFSEIGDFILTRIVARVAVPFFFMTSGFFLISKYEYHDDRIKAFVKKTALIYGTAILLYIPVNIYNGYFQMEQLLPNIIKDIAFDGTLYHLWYLPASVVGAVFAWYLVKKLDYPKALMLTGILYVIGLFGDSYYGVAERASWAKGFYDLLFQISDYTRNGLFFAPVFFVMGGLLADCSKRLSVGKSVSGLVVSFVLMLGEGLALHYLELQRHDSMYVFLVPCMYFLFCSILCVKGRRFAELRTVSLLIYILHPMMIIAVRLCAKVLRLQTLLVENSGVHFLVVCITSVLVSAVITVVRGKCGLKKEKKTVGTDRSYLEIDLKNLEHNVRVLKAAMPPECELMAVVKANAYGHGLLEVAAYVNYLGVKAFAVATIDEGVVLRRSGLRGEILILGYTAPERAGELHKYNLTQTLIDAEYAQLLNMQGCLIKAHIKIDTGMHRLGFWVEDAERAAAAFHMKYIQVTGIYTHLCAADSLAEEDISFTKGQIKCFYHLLRALKEKGITIPKVHVQSSYGLLNYPELKCDYVRVGIALYGVQSSLNDRTLQQLDLKPVFSLKSKIVLVREIKKGDSVGYSRTFVAERNSKIAVLPIGYADGYPRNLSGGKGHVLIGGCPVPIVGRVCMDQLAVDVTGIPEVKVGMTATLIGEDGEEEITAEKVAENAESITNEILSRMGQRLKVVLKG